MQNDLAAGPLRVAFQPRYSFFGLFVSARVYSILFIFGAPAEPFLLLFHSVIFQFSSRFLPEFLRFFDKHERWLYFR